VEVGSFDGATGGPAVKVTGASSLMFVWSVMSVP
jgi:hypothetical protein